MSFHFLVSNASQFRDAQLLEQHGLDLMAVSVRDGRTLNLSGTYPHEHVAAASPRVLAVLTRRLASPRGRRRVLIIGQDVGPMERSTVVIARKLGYQVALLPDGIAFAPPPDWTASAAASLMGRTAHRLGLLPSPHPSLGNSAPDLVLSWGLGWNSYWADLGARDVVATGSPRSVDFLTSGGKGSARVLLASQPMYDFLPIDEAMRWYSFLEAASTHPMVTIRLHPRERQSDYRFSFGLPPQTDASASLAEVFTSHTAVIAPVSSILLEGAAAGLEVASLVTGSTLAAFRDRSPALRDCALPRGLVPSGPLDIDALLHLPGRADEWRERFLREPRLAPGRAVQALRRLACL